MFCHDDMSAAPTPHSSLCQHHALHVRSRLMLPGGAATAGAAGLASSNGPAAGGTTSTEATADASAAETAADHNGSGATPSGDGSAQSAAQPLQQAAAAALPRMPMGLAYVGSRRAYGALAAAMRMAGRLAVTAGAGWQCCTACNFVCSQLLHTDHSNPSMYS